MTTLTTTCKGCGRQLTVPDRYQGRDLKCPRCGRAFRIEPPPPAVEPEPAATPPALAQAAPTPSGLPPAPFTEPSAAGETASAPDALMTGAVFWQLKSLGVLSTGFIGALINAFLGLVAGLVVAIVSFTPAWIALPFVRRPLAGVLAIVVLPFVYGAMGFVSGVVLAALYNVAARFVGGIKVLLE